MGNRRSQDRGTGSDRLATDAGRAVRRWRVAAPVGLACLGALILAPLLEPSQDVLVWGAVAVVLAVPMLVVVVLPLAVRWCVESTFVVAWTIWGRRELDVEQVTSASARRFVVGGFSVEAGLVVVRLRAAGSPSVIITFRDLPDPRQQALARALRVRTGLRVSRRAARYLELPGAPNGWTWAALVVRGALLHCACVLALFAIALSYIALMA